MRKPKRKSRSEKRRLLVSAGAVAFVLLVGVLLYAYQPMKEALFGKAVMPLRCVSIDLLPFQSRRDPGAGYWDTYYREQVCESAGCTFNGWEGSPLAINRSLRYNPLNDVCVGMPQNCPDVSQFPTDWDPANLGRRKVCEGVGCVFIDGGDNSARGDLCNPPPETCDNKDNNFDGIVDESACTTRDQCGSVWNVCPENRDCVRLKSGDFDCGPNSAQLCTNRFDDDRDGRVDCSDSDCADTSACRIVVQRGS